MKKHASIRILSWILLLTLLSSIVCACSPAGTNDETTAGETAPSTDKIVETEAETDAETTTPAETTAEAATTEAEVTTAPVTAEKKDYAAAIEWHLGYVGSDSNSNWKEKINPTGGYYSYSEVINLGPAGSTITFTDDNTNSNGDSNFASAAAYVFSSWKNENGVWVIDLSGYKANGTMAEYAEANGARTYTYTSEKDNECLRLCFRSGHTGSFTPAACPIVTVNSTKAPVVEKDDPSAEITAPSTPEPTGTELNVKWNAGYVGSSTNGYGLANAINPSENN